MKYTEEEKQLLNENPDFESQIQILEEEHKENLKKRGLIKIAGGILIAITTLFYVAYASIYVYRPYGGHISTDLCEMVNLKIDDSPIPNLNITEGDNCIPIYNVDYYLNGRPTFNIDLYGDRSVIYNRINQTDENGKCLINCDANGDGWPDYNIDLNGDGIVDINIIKDSNSNKKSCDVNCDINKDTIPETNIDTNNDGKPDVNLTEGDDFIKPVYNIDYKNNLIPTFNVLENGQVRNPVNDASEGKTCKVNCDINKDGWPEYNIDIKGDGSLILNELIKTGNNTTDYERNKAKDWKCIISKNLEGCQDSYKTNNNTYINIDTNGDGLPDVNISNDGGKTIQNELNKETVIDGKTWVLNKDVNSDGFPDYDIDTDDDGKPDLNITDGKTNKCIKNCDTNNDGIPDYLSEVNQDTRHKVSITNLNLDIDYDGICDVNCDLDGDLYPDINIDVNNDIIPDINIDYNHDNKPDFNVDTNDDGKPDKNIDAYGVGVCNFNCDGKNPVNRGNTCTKNCDTNNDGLPDKYVDVDNDGVCDFNCGKNGNENKDKNNNYYLDEDEKTSTLLDVTHNGRNAVYVTNPIDIKELDIEPGWDGTYVLLIKNTSNYAVNYRIFWTKVTNNFTTLNNLDYFITRDGTTYIPDAKAPTSNILLKDSVIIKSRSSLKYVLRVSFKETGVLQNEDAGKAFYGQLRVEVIK